MSRQICGFLLDSGPILVTGAGGFVGRRLMDLFELGEGDIAADCNENYSVPHGVRKIVWNLPDPPPASLGSVQYVIHLAGLSSVAQSRSSTDLFMRVNADGTRTLIDWAKERSPDARLLLASSAEVYKPSADLIDETSPLGPGSPYGKSKVVAEEMLMQSGLNFVISRSFPHFGPGQAGHFVLPSFCTRIIRSLRNGEGAIRTGNLNAVRDYLYIDDVIRAYACLLAKGQTGGIYNVCSGTGHSIGELLSLILEIPGTGPSAVTDPRLFREEDQFCQIGNQAKLGALGWTIQVPLEEGLRRLYHWWKERL